MAEVTHSTRRGVLAGAIGATTLAVCATPVAVALNAAEEARQDAYEGELRALYDAAGPDEKRMMIELLEWFVGGKKADRNPMLTWPRDVQARLRAKGLM